MIFSFFKKELIRKKILQDLLILKDKKGYLKAGLPKFDRLFGRDSLISAWQLLDYDSQIAKDTLAILSQYQGKEINEEREEEPGKILHETDIYKKDHPGVFLPFPYYGSIDSTLLYLILFSFYFQKTQDKDFLNNQWKNILKAINWIEKFGDKDGDLFLEYERKSHLGLYNQAWKDSDEGCLKIEPPPIAVVEVQGYQYLALKEIAKLALLKNDKDLSEKLLKRAEILKKLFNHCFWMEKDKYFAFALNGKKEKIICITSNPGHLLFTDIIDKEKIVFVVKRLFKKDMWTKYGIRTHSSSETCFDPLSYHRGSIWPHDNWIIAQGLKKLGYNKEYQKIKSAIILAYKKLGFLPEHYGVFNNLITVDMKVEPCYPQAWSLGALFNFINN